MTLLNNPADQDLQLFNPTIIPLPAWSKDAQYILVSRVVTEGLHQESLICLANFCMPQTNAPLPADIKPCPNHYLERLDPNGGLHCVTTPQRLNIPPTPAKSCKKAWSAFPDIPGFHDPRVFWSGKGEPLIIVNSASTYGCVGLWMVDLRAILPDLRKLLRREAHKPEPVMSYPHLTELTRNPRESRNEVEKNWMLWFPSRYQAWLQYDLTSSKNGHKQQHKGNFTSDTATVHNSSAVFATVDPGTANSGATIDRGIAQQDNQHGLSKQAMGRTFAQLVGNGLTTPNLTWPLEPSCFDDARYVSDSLNNTGHFHQATPALRLILCTRTQVRGGSCSGDLVAQDKSVHFAIVHRKFSNQMELPMRYERFVVVWEGRWPFRIIGVSQWPILLENERANPWSVDQNWPEAQEQKKSTVIRSPRSGELAQGGTVSNGTMADRKRSSAYFTYTPSLAWAWTPKTMQLPHPDLSTLSQDSDNRGEGIKDDNDGEDVEHLSGLGIGYLGDKVLIGIGLDDVEQVVSRIKVDDLLHCLRFCPGFENNF